ncbi:MAG: response regulator, partial [Gammaproteobacteria bacterium]|nr:response regulator [Gammaproteobacteria bacterium]
SRIYTVQNERYEKQLTTKNNELEQKINELDVALEQAQQASKVKSLFLASVSHEIRTPMNGVLGMVQVLRGTDLDEEQKHYIDTLDSSGKSLMLLIDDLLDLSKIESGKLELDIAPFKVFSWITDIQNISEPLFENKKVVFITELGNELPIYLEGDATRLLQITVNLISNAVKATEDGEVKLIVGGQRVSENQFNLQISVIDTGQGIADDKLELIFEAFHQLEPDRVSNKGVGLGLAICKRLSDLMNGILLVTSSLGRGSCFSLDVTLPVPEEVLNLEDAEGISENSRRLSILLVDDDAINRLAARTLLEQAGQMVIEAENGKVAIEKIKTQAFDVILMDIHMPVMDGILATKIIRQDENNQMPIIGLTASVMSDEKGGYLKAGMNAVVEKPVRIESLMKTIRNNL